MPTLPRKRLREPASLKSYGRGPLFDGSGGSGTAPGLLRYLGGMGRGARLDYDGLAGDPWRNSAVMACLRWLLDNFCEPDLIVNRTARNGNVRVVRNHPLVRLLNQPNPYYGFYELFTSSLLSYLIAGNAYWIKDRESDPYGRLRLWHVPHWEMEPRWPADGSVFIQKYVRKVNGKEIEYAPGEVVHFRDTPDPRNPRIGLNSLASIVPEIASDNVATMFTAGILRNFGVSSTVVTPEPGCEIDPIHVPAIEAKLNSRTLDAAGLATILNLPVKLNQPGISPEQMALDKIRVIPEDRISAWSGVDPMVTGLTSGAGRSTYANKAEARAGSTEQALVPRQRRFAETITSQLLADAGGNYATDHADWDWTKVKALREDQDKLADRYIKGFAGNLMTVNEARAGINLPPDPTYGKLYFWMLPTDISGQTPEVPTLPGPNQPSTDAVADPAAEGADPDPAAQDEAEDDEP